MPIIPAGSPPVVQVALPTPVPAAPKKPKPQAAPQPAPQPAPPPQPVPPQLSAVILPWSPGEERPVRQRRRVVVAGPVRYAADPERNRQ